jgi:CheY-like chemotaxis protein
MIRILYVEDNEDNVYMLRHRLERKSIEVIIASDGEQGIAAAERECPDLILMDLSLPVIDGWEAARRLKRAPATQAIPIIALSAHAMTGDRERALAAGCDDYDTKPVDLGSLMAKIEALLPPGAGP